jgi:rubrerythrin
MYGYPFYPVGFDARHAYSESFADYEKFLKMLLQAIFNERKAQQFYSRLYERAITMFDKRQIQHVYEDEVKHERMFSRLYQMLTGQMPQVPHPGDVDLSDYGEGLRKAFEDELEATEMYRDMYLNAQLSYVRDTMFEAMTDEMEHATRFTFLTAGLR